MKKQLEVQELYHKLWIIILSNWVATNYLVTDRHNQRQASIQQWTILYSRVSFLASFTWELHWRDRPRTVLPAPADLGTHPSQSTTPSAQRHAALGCASRPERNKNAVYSLRFGKSWRQTSVYLVIGFDVALVQRAVLSIASKHDQTHQTT